MQPDPRQLLARMDLATPLIGVYDAPDAGPFAPLVRPDSRRHGCVFAFFSDWLEGWTLHITRDNFGCGGASNWICGQPQREREDFLRFLADGEGLKESRELMGEWVDHQHPYRMEHPNVLIGPLKESQRANLKTVTFFVNPDQLALLMIGANYHQHPQDGPAVIAPFGSGCMEMLPLFEDLARPQAMLGATDIAMRQYLPPDLLAFTVTVPMFDRLCRLDERSFLYKPFWKNLQKARGQEAAG